MNDDPVVMKAHVQKLLMCRVKPYYIYQCDLIAGSAHLRTSVRKGVQIMESLRGHTTGYAVPEYVIDAPGRRRQGAGHAGLRAEPQRRPRRDTELRGQDLRVSRGERRDAAGGRADGRSKSRSWCGPRAEIRSRRLGRARAKADRAGHTPHRVPWTAGVFPLT